MIEQIKTEKVNEIKFCPYFYNVGDHPLDGFFNNQNRNRDINDSFKNYLVEQCGQ